jgi:hypothetical protein
VFPFPGKRRTRSPRNSSSGFSLETILRNRFGRLRIKTDLAKFKFVIRYDLLRIYNTLNQSLLCIYFWCFLLELCPKNWGWKFFRNVIRPKCSFVKSIPGPSAAGGWWHQSNQALSVDIRKSSFSSKTFLSKFFSSKTFSPTPNTSSQYETLASILAGR